MNTSMKDRLKMSIAMGIILIAIIVVTLIVIQYQIEGEKNMPYQLSKIIIINTAEGEPNTDNVDETNQWNLKINQSNNIYFFIDKTGAKDDELIESVSIDNIKITKQPNIGTVKTYMPSSIETVQFTYDDSYVVEEKLEYKGGKTSNLKTLEIGSQGGTLAIRFANTGIGNFISNDTNQLEYDGTLIQKVGVNEEDIKFKVDFDLTIKIKNIKYKANITLNLPCDNLVKEGITSKEITDMSNIVFKRTK